MQGESAAPVVWAPDPDDIADAGVTRFMMWLHYRCGLTFTEYDELWRWSVTEPEAFWEAVWAFFQVRSTTSYDTVLESRTMPGTRWFPGAGLNYAEHVLRAGGRDDVAVVALAEGRPSVEISWGQLRGQVGAMAATLT